MLGFGLTLEEEVEILSVYATAEQRVDAVASTPGWNVIGAFVMPATADVLADLMGAVSDASLVLRMRLYCVTDGHVGSVSGSEVQLTTLVDSQELSGVVSLVGGRKYQFQAEVTGGAGDGLFGIVRRATLQGIG